MEKTSGTPEKTALERLFDAIEAGDEAAVVVMLAKDPALARAAHEGGETALHRASRLDRARIAEQLIAAGANVEALDTVHSSTPLAWAAYFANTATALVLLAAGAERAPRNSYGLRPLEIAEGGARGEHPEAAHRTAADFRVFIAQLRIHS